MKILILIEIASLGGHALSALTTGNQLDNRGHEIHFAGGGGPLEEEIKKKYPFYPMDYVYSHSGRQTYFTWKSSKTYRQLSKIVSKNGFSHIHTFDARSYILASMLGIKKNIPVTCTLCGGITPYYNIPAGEKLIVFSKEQKHKLVNIYGWNKINVEVISARLDMRQFKNSQKTEIEKLCRYYQIDLANRNIMMITNFLGPKVEAIKHVLEAIQTVLKRFSDVSLVIIGERGEFFQKARGIGNKINQNIGRNAVIFTGGIMNAQRLLSASHIVMGVGRSAFEGMAYKKPTLIVGEKGYAGTVNTNNIEKIWYYNFSGRNNKHRVPPRALSSEIIRLLDDHDYYESVRHFGAEFLKSHIDIKSGISRIESVYSSNAAFAAKGNRLYRLFNMARILMPIMFDNYYNSLKSMIVPQNIQSMEF